MSASLSSVAVRRGVPLPSLSPEAARAALLAALLRCLGVGLHVRVCGHERTHAAASGSALFLR